MISDEVKQAIEDVIAADNMCYLSREKGKAIADAVEAKLSPKHPPEGQPCMVWGGRHIPGDGKHIAIANGTGMFQWGDHETSYFEVDHYRRIPTAQDARKAVQALYRNMSDSGERAGMIKATNTITDLIDNAQER